MKPLTLLIGDSFFTEEKYSALLKELQKQAADLHEAVFHLEDSSLDEILIQSRSLPFFAAHQIFRIKQAEEMKDKQSDTLAAYFANPAPKTYLIFEAESLEKSHSLFEIGQKYGDVFQFDSKQSKSQTSKFIQDRFRALGKTISPYALDRLEAQMGDAPALLETAVDQMAAYAGDQKEVDEAITAKFEENWEETDVFQLANAVFAKKTGEALKKYHSLAKNDGEILSLVGFFHWQFKRFWQAALLLDRGLSQDAVLRQCKISPKQAPYFMRQLRSLPKRYLENGLEELFQLDWKIKSGQTDALKGMELWLLKTAG